ncbi:signal peptidase II [Brevibacillus daliensis]|uniref:signal peptidase II n=1 Tax=Brevibacillus daliensis TaxID=2892995 RepID=UPI001E35C3F9|nr:signal peptidase II [Brevibacillus daliensis]
MYIFYIIALAVVALDQWTKHLVVKYMELGESIPLWENVFHLTSHRNRGAAFGMLEDRRLFFIIITLVVVVGIVYTLFKHGKGNLRLSLALSFILGGAIGNFIDRLISGEVVDFLHAVIINFPIFNVADMAITVGVGIMLIDILLDSRKSAHATDATDK